MRQLVGNDMPEGIPVDQAAVLDHWVQFYVDRVLSGQDTVTVCDGEAGIGKSMGTLYLISKVRERLGRETGTTRTLALKRDVVWRLSQLLQRVHESSREDPSVILADEGVLTGAQSGSGLSREGRQLDKALSISRIKGCSIWFLAPSIWGFASFVRMRRAKIWTHYERRGLSTWFVLKSAVEFTPPKRLPFLKARRPWNRLETPDISGTPMWREYEQIKLGNVGEALVDGKMAASKLEQDAGLRPASADQMDWRRVAQSAPVPSPLPRSPCRFCGRPVGRYQLPQHEAACPKRI
jgi:hypothetical protein